MGCRIIHNHPSQGSLSASDWRLMLAQHPGLDEMIAVNSRGSQFRGKVVTKHLYAFTAAIPHPNEPSTIVQRDTFAPIYKDFHAQLQIDPNARDPQPLFDHIGWMFSHIVNLRFAQIGWVEYHADLDLGDRCDFDGPGFQRIIQDATNIAAGMFP